MHNAKIHWVYSITTFCCETVCLDWSFSDLKIQVNSKVVR